MSRYRRKPIEVDALKWDGARATAAAIDAMVPGKTLMFNGSVDVTPEGLPLRVLTPHGMVFAQVGDWVLKDVAGEAYPVKGSLFETLYEPAAVPAPPPDGPRFAHMPSSRCPSRFTHHDRAPDLCHCRCEHPSCVASRKAAPPVPPGEDGGAA